MSDSDSTDQPARDLGEQPIPTVEAPELVPGGPDAVIEPEPDPVVPDLAPEHNPAVDDAPAETREGEDTATEATESADGEPDTDDAEESPV